MTTALHMARLDFLTIRQYLGPRQLGILLLVAFVLSFMNGNSSFSIGILMMYGLFYTAYPFAIAEKNKTDLLYASLPLHRKHLVLGRYLFALLINLGCALLTFVFTLLVSLLLRQDFLPGETFIALVACFFLFTLTECLQFPFYFKLGYSKAKLLVFLPILLIPALVFFLLGLPGSSSITFRLSVLATQAEAHPILLFLLLLLVWMMAAALSLHASIRAYAKREF